MMGVKIRSFSPLPYDLSLGDLVPNDHFYRRLEARLDLSFVRELVAPLYAKGGRPSVDPVAFFKLQLVMAKERIAGALHGEAGKVLGFRPGANPSDVQAAAKFALRSVARRHRRLSEEIAELDEQLDRLVAEAAPELVAMEGVEAPTLQPRC